MESRFIELPNGLTIHTLTAGDEDSPPLILLHGYPVNNRLWRRCIPPLARRFRVYAPDLPGHGLSDKPQDLEYNLDFYVDFLAGFYQALGLEKAGLAAHDLGGMAALAFAARRPEMVSKLVIMDTAPYEDWSFVFRLMVGMISLRVGAAVMLWPWVFRWALRLLGVRRWSAISKETAEMYRKPWVSTPGGRESLPRLLAPPPERLCEPLESLRSISAPTLILWAENDIIFSTDIARRLQKDIAGSELALTPNCGRFLPEEQPGPAAERMLSFLTSGAGRPAAILKKT